MSEKDIKKYSILKQNEKQLEITRSQNLQNNDDMASRLYDKLHGRLISGT
jgi:hypothetical protein